MLSVFHSIKAFKFIDLYQSLLNTLRGRFSRFSLPLENKMADVFDEEGGFALYNWCRTQEELSRFPNLQRYYDMGGFHTLIDWDGEGMGFYYMQDPPLNRLSYVTRNFPFIVMPTFRDIDYDYFDNHYDALRVVFNEQNVRVGDKEVWLDCYYPLCPSDNYKKPKEGEQHKVYLFQLHTFLDYNAYYNIGNHVRITEFTEYQYVKIKIQDVPGEHWAVPEPINFPHRFLHAED